MKLRETRCKWANMARRMSKSTFSAALPTTVSCTWLATKLSAMVSPKANSDRRNTPIPAGPAITPLSMAWRMIMGTANCVRVKTNTAKTEIINSRR